ncbi:hypothetical protein [Sediminimonas qiaohouensis]|nr:hypothetical protein [Sediminimonas qiaohouensis]
MVAEVARYLHQSIDEVEEWVPERMFHYHAQISPILEAERPQKT